ncbi:AraC family transcriptional regulator [Ligilactobacillus agilis]|uniref:AraC family transcriptional regulator n=1 Tax=Ligilactobacillus agilis TaxID=1601 RepID=UPI00067EDF29|nr:AraC family transcriptional regulator [Ligilactobacillus agilis]
MNPEILELLRKKSQPRDWEDLNKHFQAEICGYVGLEPVYQFYSTLNDSLEINAHSISLSVQPQASYIPWHQHNYAEMMIPLLGKCCVVVNGKKITVEQEDIIMVGKGVSHRVEETDSGAIVVNIALKNTAFSLTDLNFMLHSGTGQSISNLLFSLLSSDENRETQYCLFKVNHQAQIVNLIYDIIGEYYHDDVQSNQIIRFDLLGLFSRLIRQAYHGKLSVKDGKFTNNGTDVLSLLLYIEKHYQAITLEEMATNFGFNPNYLSAYLKKNTGLTFIKLVHLQRINVAAEYLANTVVAIEQIALKVGYENPSYFYKIFKKTMGCSPKEYRQRFYKLHN